MEDLKPKAQPVKDNYWGSNDWGDDFDQIQDVAVSSQQSSARYMPTGMKQQPKDESYEYEEEPSVNLKKESGGK